MVEQSVRARRRHSRGMHLRFSPRLYAAVHQYADGSGIAITAGVRLLVERGLALESSPRLDFELDEIGRELRALGQTMLANLIASEQTQMLLVGIVPMGEARREQLLQLAPSEARRRLLRLEAALEAEAGC